MADLWEAGGRKKTCCLGAEAVAQMSSGQSDCSKEEEKNKKCIHHDRTASEWSCSCWRGDSDIQQRYYDSNPTSLQLLKTWRLLQLSFISFGCSRLAALDYWSFLNISVRHCGFILDLKYNVFTCLDENTDFSASCSRRLRCFAGYLTVRAINSETRNSKSSELIHRTSIGVLNAKDNQRLFYWR